MMQRKSFIWISLVCLLWSCNEEGAESKLLSPVDYNIVFDNDTVGGVPIKLLEIGELQVPSGKLVVCDPLVLPEPIPFTQQVKPGTYPIKVFVAKTEDSGDRYAIVKLELSPKRADKWVLAVKPNADLSQLKNRGDFLGFPVDAGVAGVFDYQAGIAYQQFTDEFYQKNPAGNIYDDFFAQEFKKSAKNPEDPNDIGDWINFTIPSTEVNITMFHSGYGDGIYPVYWGMTNEDEVVSLVIDFFVLILPE